MGNDFLEKNTVLNEKSSVEKEVEKPESTKLTARQEAQINRFTIAFMALMVLAGIMLTMYIIKW